MSKNSFNVGDVVRGNWQQGESGEYTIKELGWKNTYLESRVTFETDTWAYCENLILVRKAIKLESYIVVDSDHRVVVLSKPDSYEFAKEVAIQKNGQVFKLVGKTSKKIVKETVYEEV